jgi:hypothetical protein
LTENGRRLAAPNHPFGTTGRVAVKPGTRIAQLWSAVILTALALVLVKEAKEAGEKENPRRRGSPHSKRCSPALK